MHLQYYSHLPAAHQLVVCRADCYVVLSQRVPKLAVHVCWLQKVARVRLIALAMAAAVVLNTHELVASMSIFFVFASLALTGHKAGLPVLHLQVSSRVVCSRVGRTSRP
jgi:hypothetical protein